MFIFFETLYNEKEEKRKIYCRMPIKISDLKLILQVIYFISFLQNIWKSQKLSDAFVMLNKVFDNFKIVC